MQYHVAVEGMLPPVLSAASILPYSNLPGSTCRGPRAVASAETHHKQDDEQFIVSAKSAT